MNSYFWGFYAVKHAIKMEILFIPLWLAENVYATPKLANYCLRLHAAADVVVPIYFYSFGCAVASIRLS